LTIAPSILVQRQYLVHNSFKSSFAGLGRRHACVVSEVVDHGLQRGDLVDDRFRGVTQGFRRLPAASRSASFISSRSAESWIGVSGFLIS